MVWRLRILGVLDIVFSTVGILATGALGNVIIGLFAPHLHLGAAWYSRWLVRGFTAPATLVEWLLPSAVSPLLLVIAICAVGEAVLAFGSPLSQMIIAREMGRRGVPAGRVKALLTSGRADIRRQRARLTGRIMRRLLARGVFLFIIGAVAAGLACAVIGLVDLHLNGFWEFAGAVGAVIGLLLASQLLDDVVDAFFEEEADPFDTLADLTV